ncbi:MAG TPA: TIGR04219 family outer membrane beta-barrel protein [Desulfobacterales bacterium]
MNRPFAYILLAIFCTMGIPAIANAVGLEVALGGWYQSPSGTLGLDITGAEDLLDLENDLNYDDETRFIGRAKLDLPFVPNVYVMATPMEFEGDGSKAFNFGGETFQGSFSSKLTLDHYDVALFYGIPLLETATLDMLNIELGINVRIFDFEARIAGEDPFGNPAEESESFTVPIPMVYAAIMFRPLEAINFEVEGRGISFGDDKSFSLIGRVRWNTFGPLFVTGGYRYDDYDIDEEGLVVEADFSGPFAEAGFSF